MRRIAVRPATSADLDAVAAIAARRSATGWTRAALEGELGRPDGIFGVSDDGYVLARMNGEEAELLDIAAAEDGRGVGTALWRFLRDEARRQGARKITLEVSAKNERARRFYRAAGCVEVGRRPRLYPDGSDAILMDAPIGTCSV